MDQSKIALTLAAFKDKDLPLTITVNGQTYHSQFALATSQNTYFEMGKAVGIEMGCEGVENIYNDDEWYQQGYKKGIEEMETVRKLAYGEGYKNGYKTAEEDIKVKLGVWD